jgi:hypothetical protein
MSQVREQVRLWRNYEKNNRVTSFIYACVYRTNEELLRQQRIPVQHKDSAILTPKELHILDN